MANTVGNIVTPGESVGHADAHVCGSGVFEEKGVLYASLVGQVEEIPDSKERAMPALRVSPGTNGGAQTAVLPKIGAMVTARVMKVTPRAAHTELLVMDGRPLGSLFKGTIRQQDVRKTETDKVEIYKCFAPGDLVRARVLSLGDRHAYFITTADNILGVIEAMSAVGVPMIPINWTEMQCPRTKTKEFRKVAKVEVTSSEQHVT